MLPAFDIRLIGYTPGGARFTEGQAVIPASNIDFVAPRLDTSTVRANLSEVVLGAPIPEYLELGVQYLDPSLGWVEGENCRLIVNGDSHDDTDPAKMHALFGVNVWEWWANKTSLLGVAPYEATGLNPEAAKTLTSVTSSGTTLTKTAHGLVNGDQVRLTVVGTKKPTGLEVGTVYWVRDVTANTFKLAGTSNGSAKTIGTATGMTFARLRAKLLATNTLFANNDKVTISSIGGVDAEFSSGDSFYVVRRTNTKFELSKSVGGDSIEIGTAGPLSMYRDTDGNRQFSAVTPGTILKTIIDEEQAKSPAWAPFLDYDFTNTTDSAGVAWPELTTLQLKPGTTLAQILNLLREQGWVDTATQGRTLRVFAPERGVDRTVGSSPVRIGRKATSKPVRRSLDNLVTHLTVRGEGTVELTLTNPAAPTELGRLESYVTLSGVVDTATATILGNQELTKGGHTQTQYTITEPAAAADNLPFVHYQVGDWVEAWIDNQWQRFRVAEFVISKNASGVLEVSTVLNDVFTDVVARLLRKRAAAVGGTISGGSGAGVDENDTRKPKAPVGLVLDSVGSWAEDGSAVASVFATWTPVTQATDSTSIDIDTYELWLRPDGSNQSMNVAASDDTTVGFGPLVAGRTYYAKVRAKTRPGQFGEFSEEVEFVAAQPLQILDAPDAPTVTSEKRTVTVKWNGLLDGAPFPAHLSHVYVAQSTSEAGTYTPVGQTIRVANGSAVITSGLPAIGGTAWFKLYPVDRLGVVGTPSTATSVVIVGITAPDVAAGTLTANLVDAGSGFFQQLSLGAPVSQGTPINRVPAPLTDTSYWGLVHSGNVVFNTWTGDTIGNRRTASTTTGIQLTPIAGEDARRYLMQPQLVPDSRKIHASWLTTGVNAKLVLVWSTGAGVAAEVTLTNDQVYEFDATAATYTIRAQVNAGLPAETMVRAEVFEVIGNRTGLQRAELSPSGLRLTNSDGSGYIDLTTNTSQYFTIQKETSPGIYDAAMSIDSDGNVAGNSLASATGVSIGGTDLMGSMDMALYEAGVGDLPYFDRIGRAVVQQRSFTWPTSMSTQFRAVASGSFTAIEGRQYTIEVFPGTTIFENTDRNLYLELMVSSDPFTVTESSVEEWMAYHRIDATRVGTAPALRSMMQAVAVPTDLYYQVSPGSTYWMLRMRCSTGAPTPAITVVNPAEGNRMVVVTDVGPSYPILSGTNHATTGTGSVTAARRTDTFNATWSATWAGATKIVGTTQFDNARSLYNATNNGIIHSSAIGFPALGLTGRTILKAEVWLQNRFTEYSRITADLGTASSTSEPASPPTRSNGGTTSFSRGQGKWVTLPTAAHAGLANGTIRAVTVGYVNDSDDYGYFDGFGQSSPPKLRITSEE